MKRIQPVLIAMIMILFLFVSTATAFAESSPVGGGIGIESPVGGGIGIDSPVGGDVVIHNPQSPTDGTWNITDVYGTGIPQGLICVQQPLSIEDGIKLASAIQSAVRSRSITVKNQFVINLSLTLNGQPYDQQGKPITFTMIYSGVRPKDNALIVHLKHDGSFELIDAVCDYDTISFTMTSLSPLALLIMQGETPVDSSATNTTVLSPKTDEPDLSAMIWLIPAAAAAVIFSIIGIRRYAKKKLTGCHNVND